MLDDTRRIVCNLFLLSSFPRYFQHVRVFSSEISFRYLIFFFFFFLTKINFTLKNLANLERWTDISFFKVSKQDYKVWRELGFVAGRNFEKKKKERKIHRLSLPFENCSKFGSFRQRAEFRDAGGLVTRAFSPRSHENSRNLLDPTCVPCPWLCIVPGSPHGLTSRRREGTVCVASIRWLCCSAASPMSVPTTAKCACFFVYAPIRVYSFTVWFFPADHSFPTFLFPPFRSPLSAFSSPSFYPSSSSSSSPSKGEGTARIHHFRM